MDPEDVATPERTEQLRCAMAMLTPGQPAWLTREDALLILERLVELQRWALGRTCCHDSDD
ncbi:MAG: hypothetical protein LC792_28355 [Actinobacteria bacterium]|nr:hypothetical protein [Actinomycetota bacterium]